MPVVRVLKSDASGNEIPEGTGARVRIEWYDSKKIAHRADLTDSEAADLIERFKLKEVEPRITRRGENRIRRR